MGVGFGTEIVELTGVEHYHALQVLQGRFVGIDVEIPVGSYWEVAFSPNGQWNGLDSATNVCEKHLSRTWGEFWETDTPNT